MSSTGSRLLLSSFRRRACPGLDPGLEFRFTGLAAQAKTDGALRRHDKPSLRLKARDFNHRR